jgi:hypothetical protein
MATAFIQHSESLLNAERNNANAMTLAAICYLEMAEITAGNEDFSKSLASESYDMATKMKLFGVAHTDESLTSFAQLSSAKLRGLSHCAWGVYGWLS